MPEEKQDPANTQMFRAFVARGEAENDRRPMLPVVLLVVAVVVVAAIVIALIAS